MPLSSLGLQRDHVLKGDGTRVGVKISSGDEVVGQWPWFDIKAGECVVVKTDAARNGGFRVRIYVVKPEEEFYVDTATRAEEPELIVRVPRRRE